MTHPYSHLSNAQSWRSAMLEPAPGHIDPATAPARRIAREDNIATLGSCFAQHIARYLQTAGFNYLFTEPPPEGMDAQAAHQRHYGVYSARYGNVYTPRQAVQLFDRAFGRFAPQEVSWGQGNLWIDPFRPQIEPHGFDSESALCADLRRHLACVRDVFLQADWIVFTLGLTEAWRSKADGAVYPLAPGVAGGAYSPERHEFVNFSYEEVMEDLIGLRARIHQVNPGARLILTVSPVPLMATYEKRHVLVSTFASKAILRAAADRMTREFANIFYFPSFEIIYSPSTGNSYFEDDLRQISELGVDHVMRVFFKNFCDVSDPPNPQLSCKWLSDTLQKDLEILCDEDLLGGPTLQEPGNANTENAVIIFDEAQYLQSNQDVAEAVANGRFSSGWHHYVLYGREEGRKPR